MRLEDEFEETMKLKATYKQSTTRDGLYAYALKVVVESDDDPNVFVFRRSTPTLNPYGRTDMVVDDVFVNVATPVDMYDIPAREPDPEHGMPYYRNSVLDLWFRNAEDVEHARRDIDEDLASLARLCENLSNDETFQYEETRIYE